MNKKKSLQLMTHVVAGYPDFNTSRRLLRAMVKEGVSYIEIQIPFSDPIGDGATILQANQSVLDAGISTSDCFDFIEEIRNEIPVQLFIMTYANIVYRFGIERFLRTVKKLRISGLIIPDIPFDEPEHALLLQKGNPPLIPVISSNTSEERLSIIGEHCNYMLYCTLRIGITGARMSMETKMIQYLKYIRSVFSVPIIGGFGISSVKQLGTLRKVVDIAVIGSHIINILNKDGVRGVRKFLQDAKQSL